MNRIVSSIPGRVRIRDKALRNLTRLRRLESLLQELKAISVLRTNPTTGSVLVYFDQRLMSNAELELALDQAVNEVLKIPLPTKRHSSLKKRLNRYSKWLMLVSLVASLAFATKRRTRRWHILTGNIFIAGLLVHLSIYRKLLFR